MNYLHQLSKTHNRIHKSITTFQYLFSFCLIRRNRRLSQQCRTREEKRRGDAFCWILYLLRKTMKSCFKKIRYGALLSRNEGNSQWGETLSYRLISSCSDSLLCDADQSGDEELLWKSLLMSSNDLPLACESNATRRSVRTGRLRGIVFDPSSGLVGKRRPLLNEPFSSSSKPTFRLNIRGLQSLPNSANFFPTTLRSNSIDIRERH